MPLTEDGWVSLNPDDALAKSKQKVQQLFGADTDVSSGSPMGRMAQLLTDLELENDNAAQDAYDNSFWNSATGVALDRLATQIGIQRHQAQYAQADLQITGKPGYLIPANTEFMTDNGDSFLSDLDTQIDNNGNAVVSVHSTEMAGYTNVDANTIINQANPVDEIETVTNPSAATGGADEESDYDFRNRGAINQNSPEGPTTGGIRTALINVDGVSGVTVQNNQSKETDSHGNPPNTIHIYVVGGNDIAIANKLADVLAGGATTVGKQSYDVNIFNNIVTVNFDRAVQKTISFKLDIDVTSGFDVDAVKQSVQDYLATFEMGDEIILNKLNVNLYQLIGVKKVNSIQIKYDDKDWSDSDLQLDNVSFAVTHNENIEVDIHG
ncbi:baseplate J/gp47 family protein [Apilactobacillus timberlakei]|uniref:Baseplate protein J-like barrel domain-containing protein n=1 Tax=Apilactobacillus timberlakei TaxID=2008380 RepID=A0ABY2YT74_9LACO|nr:baseplate J/gp47 family protein [Apilactobacillus timberlakei]TPR12798.1 hypothetical protein DY048_07245 [Apilactobacillus timberlakei]TPR13610.1 hypothetical protein DY052_07745 [Apilactobacillus timberlakei]